VGGKGEALERPVLDRQAVEFLAAGRIPQADLLAPGRDDRPIGGEERRPGPSRGAPKLTDLSAGEPGPEANRPVHTARDQAPAVGREGGRNDLVLVALAGAEFLAGGRGPEADRSIPPPGDQEFAVRGGRQGRDLALPPPQRRPLFAR